MEKVLNDDQKSKVEQYALNLSISGLKKLLFVLLFPVSIIALFYYFPELKNPSVNTLAQLILGGIIYIASHILRVFRLMMLLDNKHLRFRNLIFVQLLTNIVNLLLPFRLGELARFIGYEQINHNALRTATCIFVERTFDFLWLFALVVFLTKFFDVPIERENLIAAIAVIFLAVFSLTFFALPQVLREIKLYLVKSYTNSKMLTLINVLGDFQKTVSIVSKIYKKKLALLLLTTTLIWSLEILVFVILYIHLLNLSNIFSLSFSKFLEFLQEVPGAWASNLSNNNFSENSMLQLGNLEFANIIDYGQAVPFWAHSAVAISLFVVLTLKLRLKGKN